MRQKLEFVEALTRLVDDANMPMQIEGVQYPTINDFKSLMLFEKLWIVTPLFTKLFDIKNKSDVKLVDEIKISCSRIGYVKFL